MCHLFDLGQNGPARNPFCSFLAIAILT